MDYWLLIWSTTLKDNFDMWSIGYLRFHLKDAASRRSARELLIDGSSLGLAFGCEQRRLAAAAMATRPWPWFWPWPWPISFGPDLPVSCRITSSSTLSCKRKYCCLFDMRGFGFSRTPDDWANGKHGSATKQQLCSGDLFRGSYLEEKYLSACST